LQAHYPELLKDVRIRVIELMDYVLSTYDRKIGEFTHKQFERAGGLLLDLRSSDSHWCIESPHADGSIDTSHMPVGKHCQPSRMYFAVYGLTAVYAWMCSAGIELVLNTRVASVRDGCVAVVPCSRVAITSY
jgi:hypothetical protein